MITMHVEELAYGEEVPGVTCPECGSSLMSTEPGAWCAWCDRYVPVLGSLVVVDEDTEDGGDDEA